MSDFAFPVSAQTGADMKPRVLETQYGGGYRQSLADGVNNVLGVYSLVFTGRSWADLTVINNFLKSKKGFMSFTWTPPPPIATDEGEIIVKCKEWGFTWDGGNATGIHAIFEQVAA